MRKTKAVSYFLILCVVIVIGGCGRKTETKEEKTELHILAAASLTDVLTEAAGIYQKEETNVELIFDFDSSGTLKTQIEQGAPADVFISASERQMKELDEAGLMKRSSIVKLLENRVVLIKASESDLDIHSFEEAAEDKVSMVAIGNADVPVGQYTEEIYRKLGLWQQICTKANWAANVRQVLDWVASGNVDCGIVYATDAMVEEKAVVVCEAPEGACERVIYPAGAVQAGGHPEEAEAFLRYLKTKEMKALFEKYGFTNYEE